MRLIPRFTELRQRLFDSHTAYMERNADVFIKARVHPGVSTPWICYPMQLRPELGWGLASSRRTSRRRASSRA